MKLYISNINTNRSFNKIQRLVHSVLDIGFIRFLFNHYYQLNALRLLFRPYKVCISDIISISTIDKHILPITKLE